MKITVIHFRMHMFRLLENSSTFNMKSNDTLVLRLDYTDNTHTIAFRMTSEKHTEKHIFKYVAVFVTVLGNNARFCFVF